jgi:hypothetical protein
MTVVLEDQVKTIAAEISEQFGDILHFDVRADIEDIVRAVIAQYDISSIARPEPPIMRVNYGIIAQLEPPP